MIGEIKLFRRRLFGFDRGDVVEYIKKLAGERNRYLAERDLAEHKSQMLARELQTLKRELELSQGRERQFRESTLENAAKTLVALEAEFISMLAEIKSVSAEAGSELDKACDIVSRLPSIFERTGAKLVELRQAVDSEIAKNNGGNL